MPDTPDTAGAGQRAQPGSHVFVLLGGVDTTLGAYVVAVFDTQDAAYEELEFLAHGDEILRAQYMVNDMTVREGRS